MNVIQCLQKSEDDYKLVTEVDYDSESVDPKDCVICLEPVNAVPFYILYPHDVDIPIHKSCGELPGRINHPPHPPHPLKIFNFAQKENTKSVDLTCDACFTLYPGFKYIIYPQYVVDIPIHKSCGELPGTINHPLHPPHPLKIFVDAPKKNTKNVDLTCDACFTVFPGFKYGCRICKKSICYPCISKYDVEGSQGFKQRVEKFTPFHPHKLQLTYLPSVRVPSLSIFHAKCYCCLKDVRDFGYLCLQCDDFFCHESCVFNIPEQITSSFHPQHPLTLEQVHPRTRLTCKACLIEIRQVQLGCSVCNCSFHVSCGQYTSPGLRVNRDLTLFYVNDYFEDDGKSDDSFSSVYYSCRICDEKISQGPMYRLLGSIRNFHVECLMPPTLDHPCHHHPLKLTSSVESKTEAEKYCCDVCEEEEDFEHYVYHCERCYFNVYIECVFTEENELLKGELLQLFDKIKNSDPKGELGNFNSKDELQAFNTGDKEEDSTSGDDGEDDDSEEDKFNLKNLTLSELGKKITNLTEHIEQLKEEIDKSTEELSHANWIYEKKFEKLTK